MTDESFLMVKKGERGLGGSAAAEQNTLESPVSWGSLERWKGKKGRERRRGGGEDVRQTHGKINLGPEGIAKAPRGKKMKEKERV